MERRIMYVKLINHVHLLGVNLSLKLYYISSIIFIQITKHICWSIFFLLFILYRSNTKSANRLNYLNYGYTKPGEETIFDKYPVKKIAFVSVAFLIILIGASLGIYFGIESNIPTTMAPMTTTTTRPEPEILSRKVRIISH